MHSRYLHIIPDFFIADHVSFTSYTEAHLLPVVVIAGIFSAIIYLSRKFLSESAQWRLGWLLALIPLFSVMSRMVITYDLGLFTIDRELPLHLCRTLAFLLPAAIFFKNKTWLGVCYFAITGGTLQAIITPDIDDGWPHYGYIFYWVTHVGLFMTVMYTLAVLNFRPTKRDIFNTMIFINIYMVITLMVNIAIGSNYFYTFHKPVNPSLLDHFGPWPVYLLVVEFLALMLFYILFLPFRNYGAAQE